MTHAQILHKFEEARAEFAAERRAAQRASEDKFRAALKTLQDECEQVGHLFGESDLVASLLDDGRCCVVCRLAEPTP